MKLLLLGILVFVTLQINAQQNHIITGYDHYFSPDTSYVNVGDTIRLVSIGYHSITEQDSTDWVNNAAADNGGFWIGFGASTSQDWFVVSQTGKYYFNCKPHAAMGMKGVLYVEPSLGILQSESEKEFSVSIQDNEIIYLNYFDVNNVKIYSISGKLMHAQQLANPSQTLIPNLNLPRGLYIVSFSKDNKVITNRKIILN